MITWPLANEVKSMCSEETQNNLSQGCAWRIDDHFLKSLLHIFSGDHWFVANRCVLQTNKRFVPSLTEFAKKKFANDTMANEWSKRYLHRKRHKNVPKVNTWRRVCRKRCKYMNFASRSKRRKRYAHPKLKLEFRRREERRRKVASEADTSGRRNSCCLWIEPALEDSTSEVRELFYLRCQKVTYDINYRLIVYFWLSLPWTIRQYMISKTVKVSQF